MGLDMERYLELADITEEEFKARPEHSGRDVKSPVGGIG